jgi:hypothetical protein
MFLCICLGCVELGACGTAGIVLGEVFTGAGEAAFNSEYQAYAS